MESAELRNQLLSELIGKMQDRLADKEYPEEKKEETAPVEVEMKSEEPVTSDASESEDISDADLDALMQTAE